MRQIQLRQQPVARASLSAQVPARAGGARSAAPEVADTLDQAAALWTTRRIRSFLMLLEQPARAAHR
jgi:hypothetical protein